MGCVLSVTLLPIKFVTTFSKDIFMADLLKRMREFTIADELKREGSYPYFREIESEQGTTVTIGGKNILMFGSNNYMGLTNHPKVKEAAKSAIDKYGTGYSGSRFLNGTSFLHTQFETKLAAFLKKEAALIFSTGYQTNLGVVATLTGRHDYILLDEYCHASIIEGSRLSFSRIVKYRHNDMDSLEKELSSMESSKAILIVADGVFSMEGDIAKLPEIVQLAQQYEAAVMVDDAHSIGVLGADGSGTASHFGISDGVNVITGTFSKSLASLGGFVAGEKVMIDYLKHHSRPLIFSASMPPASVAAAMAALDVIRDEPERIQQLWDNTHYAINGLSSLGFDIGKTETPIIPLFIRDDQKTFQFTNMLFEKGLFVNPVVSPAVPKDSSLIRISLMATHTHEQIDQAIDIISQVAKKVNIHSKQLA
jgi:8-amino-7-oxononanoate synthase